MANPPHPPRRDDTAEVARLVVEIKRTADLLLEDHVDRGDAKLLARAFEEMRIAFGLLAKYRDRRKVTVFGSARTQRETPLYELAVEFGKAIVSAGYMVITGAGEGIMEAAHVGAGTENAIGFNIVLPFEQEPNYIIADDHKLVSMNYFFTRKLILLKDADALILFPGGFGTLDEGFEALTLLQTGKSEMMPVVMIDVPGGLYWEHWRDYVDRSLYRQGMISKEDFSLFHICHDPMDAVAEIQRFYRVFHSHRYVRGRLVLRLKYPIADALFERVCAEYADILCGGGFERGPAHPDEGNEPWTRDLHRLHVAYNRRSLGRLRQLIDLINQEAAPSLSSSPVAASEK